MVNTQYSLSWESYRSSICNGFSSLQQNGEFVDMTLAADGYFVKVHQVMVALASPYLKDLLTSAPCQHPVIFLNNVSYNVLCLLLEYIYTGEALVPADTLSSFMDTAKTLHIKGLDNMASNTLQDCIMNNSHMDDGKMYNVNISTVSLKGNTKHLSVSTGSGITEQINLPLNAKKVYFKQQSDSPDNRNLPDVSMTSKDSVDYSAMVDDSDVHYLDDDDDDAMNSKLQSIKTYTRNKNDKDKMTSNLQFTVSIRGSLQVILNRYIYNLHSVTRHSGIRRWRCVDYRNKKCMAFVVTQGNIVLNRANFHNHSFHDKKILAKIEKKAIYSALDEVKGYKEKDIKDIDIDNDTSMEQDEYISMNFNEDAKDSSKKKDTNVADSEQ